MSRVQQRAGGGKITVEGLAAGNIKKDVAVTVKQGSKTVQSVTGALQIKRADALYYSAGAPNTSADMKAILPDIWQTLTTENFGVTYLVAGSNSGNTTVKWNYNNSTGILTLTSYTPGCAVQITCFYLE